MDYPCLIKFLDIALLLYWSIGILHASMTEATSFVMEKNWWLISWILVSNNIIDKNVIAYSLYFVACELWLYLLIFGIENYIFAIIKLSKLQRNMTLNNTNKMFIWITFSFLKKIHHSISLSHCLTKFGQDVFYFLVIRWFTYPIGCCHPGWGLEMLFSTTDTIITSCRGLKVLASYCSPFL